RARPTPYGALPCRPNAPAAAASGRARRRYYRDICRRDCASGTAAIRNPARPRHSRRRRAIFHFPVGSQAARMTTIAADDLVLERGGARLVSNLALSLGPVGAVALIGPNGAGKSMTLKMLAGIEMPTAGHVRIGDRQLTKLSHAERARAIGFLPQHFEPHWDLTVFDLVRLGAERTGPVADSTIEDITARFELAEFRKRRWSTLSGGERARGLLAMVLAVDPLVLLGEEPAASLDIRHRIDVVEILVARARDRLSVVVMHDLDLTFRYFERVIVLDHGRIVADGPARDLVEDARLDAAFGVKFERLRTAHGPLLRAT